MYSEGHNGGRAGPVDREDGIAKNFISNHFSLRALTMFDRNLASFIYIIFKHTPTCNYVTPSGRNPTNLPEVPKWQCDSVGDYDCGLLIYDVCLCCVLCLFM